MARTSNPRQRLGTYLRKLSDSRSNGIVTANDVYTWLRRNKISTSVRTVLSYANSTLRRPAFQPIGVQASGRPQSKGRKITAWMAS
jgi:hypothetical protein